VCVCVYRYEAELVKKQTMLLAVQQDMSTLSDKYAEQVKQMEDEFHNKCTAAERKWLVKRHQYC